MAQDAKGKGTDLKVGHYMDRANDKVLALMSALQSEKRGDSESLKIVEVTKG